MKKILMEMSVILCLFLFISCQKNTPETTITEFSEHWYRGELTEAKKYVNPDSKSIIDLLIQSRSTEDLTKMKENRVHVEFIEPQYITDSTLVYRCRLILNDQNREANYHLDKIKDKWYINIIN